MLGQCLQVQPSDWRKQVLQELGAPAHASQAHEAQGLASAALPEDDAFEGGRITGPGAADVIQPALRCECCFVPAGHYCVLSNVTCLAFGALYSDVHACLTVLLDIALSYAVPVHVSHALSLRLKIGL